jgi:hypothetical protein
MSDHTRYRIRPLRPGVRYAKHYRTSLAGAIALAERLAADDRGFPHTPERVIVEGTNAEAFPGQRVNWQNVRTIEVGYARWSRR